MKRLIETKVVNPLLEQYGIPAYKTTGAAGMDLYACIAESVTIPSGKNKLMTTGMAKAAFAPVSFCGKGVY